MTATETKDKTTTPPVTPASLWALINVASFMGAMVAAIKASEKTLGTIGGVADKMHLTVTGVPVTYSVTENRLWVSIDIGATPDGSTQPQVKLYLPYCWVTA